MDRHKIILDVDLSNGMPVQDIDDGLALAVALSTPEFELLGATTCGGNCRTHESTHNTLRWLEMAGRDDIPVAEGREDPLLQDVSSSFQWLEDTSGALQAFLEGYASTDRAFHQEIRIKGHEFIIEMVKKYPGEVTIIKEGSLTNLALALLVDPSIAPLVKSVVHMGGSFSKREEDESPVGFTDTPNMLWRYVVRMNTNFDPEATEIVVRSGIPFVFVTGEVTSRVQLRHEHADQIEAAGTPYHEFMAATSRPWIEFHREVREDARCTDV